MLIVHCDYKIDSNDYNYVAHKTPTYFLYTPHNVRLPNWHTVSFDLRGQNATSLYTPHNNYIYSCSFICISSMHVSHICMAIGLLIRIVYIYTAISILMHAVLPHAPYNMPHTSPGSLKLWISFRMLFQWYLPHHNKLIMRISMLVDHRPCHDIP